MSIIRESFQKEKVSEDEVEYCDVCGVDETCLEDDEQIHFCVGNPYPETTYVIYGEDEKSSFETIDGAVEYMKRHIVDREYDTRDGYIDEVVHMDEYHLTTIVDMNADFTCDCCTHCKDTLLSIYEPGEMEVEPNGLLS